MRYQRAQTLTEYAVLISLIVMSCYVTVIGLGWMLRCNFAYWSERMNDHVTMQFSNVTEMYRCPITNFGHVDGQKKFYWGGEWHEDSPPNFE